jgi:hypothetical protein
MQVARRCQENPVDIVLLWFPPRGRTILINGLETAERQH